jgi:hypothetical protein
MSQFRKATLVLAAQLLGWTVTSQPSLAMDGGPDCRKATNGGDLVFRIEVEKRPYGIGESVRMTAILTNCTKSRQAIDERALFRYISHERLPRREGELSVGGQVIGDGPPPTSSNGTIVLAPDESLSRTRDVAPLLAGVLTEPGEYKIWLEYCYSGPKQVKGSTGRRRCVQSNEIVLSIVPRRSGALLPRGPIGSSPDEVLDATSNPPKRLPSPRGGSASISPPT